ncbi:MAG: hypothetical protein ACKVQC_09140 [Elusimicrobiota bacterium]
MKKISVTVCLMVSVSSSLWAGAWLREKNEVYSKVSFSKYSADKVFAPKKNKKLNGPKYSEYSSSFYGEFGFTEKWTGITQFSFKSATSKFAGISHSESGLTDLWFYMKRKLPSEKFTSSVQLGVKTPLGYSERKNPPLGQGQVDLECRLLAGKSLYPWPVYLSSEVGYRKRNGDYSDEIPYVFETGFFPKKNLLLKVGLDGISNLTNDEASNLNSNFNDFVFDKEFMKLNFTIALFQKSGWGYEIFYDTLLTGANTSVGQTVGVGLSWQGKLWGPGQ